MRLSGLPLLTLAVFSSLAPVRAADEKQVRALLDAKITFPVYVFAGERFQEPQVAPAKAVDSAIEALDGRGVIRRDVRFKNLRGAGGANAARADHVLDSDWNARERRQRFAPCDRRVNPLMTGTEA